VRLKVSQKKDCLVTEFPCITPKAVYHLRLIQENIQISANFLQTGRLIISKTPPQKKKKRKKKKKKKKPLSQMIHTLKSNLLESKNCFFFSLLKSSHGLLF
jgi:hypothetical protein